MKTVLRWHGSLSSASRTIVAGPLCPTAAIAWNTAKEVYSGRVGTNQSYLRKSYSTSPFVSVRIIGEHFFAHSVASRRTQTPVPSSSTREVSLLPSMTRVPLRFLLQHGQSPAGTSANAPANRLVILRCTCCYRATYASFNSATKCFQRQRM